MAWCRTNIGIGTAFDKNSEAAARAAHEDTSIPLPYSLKAPILSRAQVDEAKMASELAKKASNAAKQAKKTAEQAQSALNSLGLPQSLSVAVSEYLLDLLDSPAYANLTPSFLKEVFNPQTPDKEGVKYYSVASRTDRMPIWHPLWLPKQVLDGAEAARQAKGMGAEERWRGNDGLVSVDSAKWGHFMGVIENCDVSCPVASCRSHALADIRFFAALGDARIVGTRQCRCFRQSRCRSGKEHHGIQRHQGTEQRRQQGQEWGMELARPLQPRRRQPFETCRRVDNCSRSYREVVGTGIRRRQRTRLGCNLGHRSSSRPQSIPQLLLHTFFTSITFSAIPTERSRFHRILFHPFQRRTLPLAQQQSSAHALRRSHIIGETGEVQLGTNDVGCVSEVVPGRTLRGVRYRSLATLARVGAGYVERGRAT